MVLGANQAWKNLAAWGSVLAGLSLCSLWEAVTGLISLLQCTESQCSEKALLERDTPFDKLHCGVELVLGGVGVDGDMPDFF